MSRNGTSHNILPTYAGSSHSRSSTLADETLSTTHYSLRANKLDLKARSVESHNVWIEIEPGKHVIHNVRTVDTASELQEGHVPQAWYNHVQRVLRTAILVGVIMANVEAQILHLVVTTSPSLEQTMAVCFAVTALFSTSLAALYCAVTYIWMKTDWTPRAHKFDEWVSSSVSTMIVWSSTGLIIGVYCGFLSVICFLFATIDHSLATICTVIFVVSSISPLIWGLYRWQGLYTHALVWKADLDGPAAISARKAADRSNYV